MEKVPVNDENMMKCICEQCPVQAKSACSRPKIEKMMEMISNMSKPKEEMQSSGMSASIVEGPMREMSRNRKKCPYYSALSEWQPVLTSISTKPVFVGHAKFTKIIASKRADPWSIIASTVKQSERIFYFSSYQSFVQFVIEKAEIIQGTRVDLEGTLPSLFFPRTLPVQF